MGKKREKRHRTTERGGGRGIILAEYQQKRVAEYKKGRKE